MADGKKEEIEGAEEGYKQTNKQAKLAIDDKAKDGVQLIHARPCSKRERQSARDRERGNGKKGDSEVRRKGRAMHLVITALLCSFVAKQSRRTGHMSELPSGRVSTCSGVICTTTVILHTFCALHVCMCMGSFFFLWKRHNTNKQSRQQSMNEQKAIDQGDGEEEKKRTA